MQQNDKALVILTPGFPADESETACLPAQQQLVLAIKDQFPNITILVVAFEYPVSNTPYLWHKQRVFPVPGKKTGRVQHLLRWVRVWKQLKKLAKQYELAGIFSFWLGDCALVGKWFAKANGLQHFTWLLGQDARQGNRYIKWINPVAGELVAMSDFLADEFVRNYGIKPAHIIPNAIFAKIYRNNPIPKDIDLLGVGSLISLKQYELFIETVASLQKKNPDISAVICGKGKEKQVLEALISRKGLSRNIQLTGEIPNETVFQYMERAKILLHPSSYEGFSGACLEALFAGAHVVSFCKPMHGWIRHWHIVKNLPEMIELCDQLRKDIGENTQPVLPYRMEDTARAVMGLFFKQPSANS